MIATLEPKRADPIKLDDIALRIKMEALRARLETIKADTARICRTLAEGRIQKS